MAQLVYSAPGTFTPEYMKLLEMFSGTGSVGTVAKDMGWDVVSLDLKGADINCDILLQ